MVGKNKLNQNGGNYENFGNSQETGESENEIQFETYNNERNYKSPEKISKEAVNRLAKMRARFKKLGGAAFANA